MTSPFQMFPTSLDTLPPEVIDRIVQNMLANTIHKLMCVNQYLYESCSASSIWKAFLYYPEKFYKSDVLSNSADQKVAGILEDMSAGRVSRWRGYYRIQQARLQVWASTQSSTQTFDSIPLEMVSVGIQQMREMVDDRGEHWLFILYKNDKLCVWNITTTPRLLNPLFIHTDMHILDVLPQGKVFLVEMKRTYKSIVWVYQIDEPGNELIFQFRYKFDMDKVLSPNTQSLEYLWCDSFTYVIVEHMFISCTSGREGRLYDLKQLSMHIWNVNSGEKIAQVSLGQSSAVQEFLKFLENVDGINLQDTDMFHEIMLYPGDLSRIIVVFTCGAMSQVSIFDLNTNHFTCLITQNISAFHQRFLSRRTIQCHMYADKVCVAESHSEDDFPWLMRKSTVKIFSTSATPHNQCQEAALPHATMLKSVEAKYFSRKITDFSIMESNIVIFKHSKVLVQNANKVSIIDLDTSTLNETQITVFPFKENISGYMVLGFIQPSLLLMYNSDIGYPPPRGSRNRPTFHQGRIKVFNVVNNNELFNCDDVSIRAGCIAYYREKVYPSKLIVQIKGDIKMLMP